MKSKTFYIIIITYAIIGLLVSMSSCKTHGNFQNSKKDSIIYLEKLITKTIVNPQDSANIRAKLECDKNGKILLSWFDSEVSKNAKLKFKIDSLGNLLADFKSGGDSIQFVYKDIYHYNEKTITQTKYINKLNIFQKIAVYWFVISIILFVIFITYTFKRKING